MVLEIEGRPAPEGQPSMSWKRYFAPQVWSTPLDEHRDTDGRRVLVMGEGRWHAPQPEGLFTYVEFHIDDIAYNLIETGILRQAARPRDG